MVKLRGSPTVRIAHKRPPCARFQIPRKARLLALLSEVRRTLTRETLCQRGPLSSHARAPVTHGGYRWDAGTDRAENEEEAERVEGGRV